jgi:hypothetical protein
MDLGIAKANNYDAYTDGVTNDVFLKDNTGKKDFVG